MRGSTLRQQTTRYQNLLMDSARWEGFQFRDGDIVISTPAKCGTTWTQTICALLIFQTPDLPDAMEALSMWPDMVSRPRDDLLNALAAQRHRRFIKTHTPLDGLPFDERATYICVGRDPRDAAISWDNHFRNTKTEALMALRVAAIGADPSEEVEDPPPVLGEYDSLKDRFWAWVDSDDMLIGLSAMFHHLSGFWAARNLPNVVMLHYSDLKADLEGQMRYLAGRLGIDVAEDMWPELVRAASFDHMRAEAKRFAPEISIWHDPAKFFNRGANGQWWELLDSGDLRRYTERVGRLADRDLVAWAHGGTPF